jgi:hypothetical protein
MATARVALGARDRDRYRLWLSQGVDAAFTVARRQMRLAVMNSPVGTYNPNRLWKPEWWVEAVNREIAPVLWRIYWTAANEAAKQTGRPVGMAAWRIEARWRAQCTRLYEYADTVGRRVAELAEQGDGEARGWMLDRLGLVAAAGPMSDGIAGGMVDTEGLEAEQGGLDAGTGGGIKTWIAAGPNPRPTHSDADGQSVLYGEQFVVGGYECDYPGDGALPAEERCNCYCAVQYAVEVSDTPGVLPIPPEFAGIEVMDEMQLGELLLSENPTVPASASIDSTIRGMPGRLPSEWATERALADGGRISREVNEALDRINTVHLMPDGIPGVTVHQMTESADNLGQFTSLLTDPEGPRYIAIRPGGPAGQIRATVVHEVGHYFDWGDFDTPVGVFGTGVGRYVPTRGWVLSEVSEGFAPVMQAIQATPEYNTLRAVLDGLVAGDTPLVAGMNTVQRARMIESLEYLLDPAELWARSYAQFVALESGDAAMLAAVRTSTMSGGAALPSQWEAATFGPVQDAIAAMFRAQGL